MACSVNFSGQPDTLGNRPFGTYPRSSSAHLGLMRARLAGRRVGLLVGSRHRSGIGMAACKCWAAGAYGVPGVLQVGVVAHQMNQRRLVDVVQVVVVLVGAVGGLLAHTAE